MMTLGSIESLFGSVWAVFAALGVGYIGGHLVPISKIAGWIPGKKD
jgi:hypothetical protein